MAQAKTVKVTSDDIDSFLKTTPVPQSVAVPQQAQNIEADIDGFLKSTPAPQVEEPGILKTIGKKALDTVIAVGNTVDSYTGAPVRSAIGAIQNDQSPLQAYVKQFGKDPGLAPTGKQIAEKAGFSAEDKYKIPFSYISPGLPDVEFSPAGAVGLAVDIGADPTNVIPVGAAAKMGARLGVKGGIEAARLGAKGTALGIDVITGAKAGAKTLEYAGEKADQVRKVIENYFKPTRADDFEKLFAIAQKNGIDTSKLPEAVEFGKDSLITRLSRARAEGPLGEKFLKDFTESLDQVDNATNKAIESIGSGIVPNREQAGKILRDGYDEAVGNLFKENQVRYSQIVKQHPQLKVSPEAMTDVYKKLNDVTNFAERRLKGGVTAVQEEQAKRLLRTVDSIRNSDGSFENLYNAMSDIGEAAYKPQNTMAAIPADVDKMRDIYNTLSSTLIGTVQKQVGPKVAEDLVKSNQAISGFMKATEPFAKKLGDASLANETIFDSLIKRGDSRQLQSLQAIIPPDKFQQVKAAYLDSLLPRNAEGGVQYRTWSNIMNKEKERMAQLLNPEEAESLTELATLGTRFGTPILSTSGTGASNRLRNLPTAIADAVLDDTAIDKMKMSARGQLFNVPTKNVKGFTAPITDPTRGYIFRKGSQTYSTQKQNEGK